MSGGNKVERQREKRLTDNYIFEMHGRAFELGDRLDKVAAGLTALQHFFDGQYRAATNRERLSDKDRENYQVRIQRYRNGSFIAELGAFYAGFQGLLSLTSSPKELWEIAKTTFDFLKLIYGAAHEKKQVSIAQDGIGHTAVIAGDTHIIFNAPVTYIGTQIISSIREMDKLLDDQEVSRISLKSQSGERVIELESNQKGLFFPPTTVEETPVGVACDIFDFNKYEKAGRARVGSNQHVPPGNYRFRSVGPQTVDEFILSMTETQVTLNCLIKYEHDPLTESKIAEMLVVNVAA